MKGKAILVVLTLFLTAILNAQTLLPKVIATSGGFTKNSSFSICWTLGESIIETYSSENMFLTQGFQQPNYLTTSINEFPDLSFNVKIYPNPAENILNINLLNFENQIFTVQIYDLAGKLIIENTLDKSINQLNIEELSKGMYMLKLYDQSETKAYKSFKFQKIN